MRADDANAAPMCTGSCQMVATTPDRKGPQVSHEAMDTTTVNVPPSSKQGGGTPCTTLSRTAAGVGVRSRVSGLALAIFLMVALAMAMVFATPNGVWADEANGDAAIEETEQGTGAETNDMVEEAVETEESGEGSENTETVENGEGDGNVADGTETDGNTVDAANGGIELYAVEDATTVVDPDTTNAWNTIAASSNSTENIGRIWTDKSVFNDDYEFEGALDGTKVEKGSESDFLVSLSAISSISNLASKVTHTDPLDIVLIIDRSSSMNNDIEQAGSYVEVNPNDVVESHGHEESIGFGAIAVQDSTGGEYYALIGDEYVRIEEEVRRVDVGWTGTQHYNEHVRWTLNGETVTPQDTQFYEYRSGGTISRMEALKTAANNFIDSAANLPNSDQVRIGIVSFAGSSEDDRNASRIDQQLTSLSGNNAQSLKNTVNGIYAPSSSAGTYPSGAFDDAQ